MAVKKHCPTFFTLHYPKPPAPEDLHTASFACPISNADPVSHDSS